MPVRYFYFQDRLPQANTTRPAASSQLPLNDIEGQPTSPPVNVLSDAVNPVYNFSQNFIEKLQAISPVDVAQSVPYISLCSLNKQGQVLTDFNQKFFSKNTDMDGLRNAQRFGDRPQLSMQNISITQTLADGGGFLTRQNLTMTLKLHKPDLVTNRELEALLLPGMPMRLKYGWNSPNETLNEKDIVLFNIKDYDITFSEVGEAMLTINGVTFSENFAIIYVGDLAEKLESDDLAEALRDNPLPLQNDGSTNLTNPQVDGLAQQRIRLDTYFTYIVAQQVVANSSAQRNISVLDKITRLYVDAAKGASEKIKGRYQEAKQALESKKKSHPEWFTDVQKVKGGQRISGECVTVHDIIGTLCGPTLDALEGTVIPPNKNYQFVYGSFNETLGSFAGTSIANFPIHWPTFNNILRNGFEPPSLQGIFNIIANHFLCDEDYWRTKLLKRETVTELDIPKIAFHISSHLIGDQEVAQVSIVDINRNVPVTQARLRSRQNLLISQQDFESTVVGNSGIPIIRFGNTAGFIRSVSMSHQNNSFLKAFLINRATTTDITPRKPITANQKVALQQPHALFIPLKGEMQLLGQVDWRPARCFFLSSGIYFLDGVYVITQITHTLDNAGFSTQIAFAMH